MRSSDPATTLAVSRSSTRSRLTPPLRLATTQDASAAQAPPTWRSPVGEGAKRVRTVPGGVTPRRRSPGGALSGLDQQERHQRLLHVKPVLGLVPHARPGSFERGLVDLFAAVRGQAMQ